MPQTDKYNILTAALRKKAAEILPEGSVLSLYGSRARGDASPESDWDLHLLIPGTGELSASEIDKFAWPFDSVGLEFGEIVNTRVYSFAGWVRRSFLPFFKNVEHESIILFKK